MEQTRRFHSLTGLKGIFTLLIVFFHTLPTTPLISAIPLTSFIGIYGGTLGNYMFFMLSGFLICHTYKDRIAGKTVAFPHYLVRRLKKLYPLYIVTNIAALLVTMVQYGMSAVNLRLMAFTALLQAGGGLDGVHPYNGPTWFVSALFVCYIAYYFLAYHAKNPTQYACGIVFGIVWGYTLLCEKWHLPFCHEQNGAAFLNFFLGCALAELFPRITAKTHRWLQPVSILALGVSAVLLLRYGVEIICGDSRVAFAFVICPLVIYLALEQKAFVWLLESRPFRLLGSLSVSLYFWHFVIYDGFRFVYRLAVPGGEIREGQYLVYLGVTVLVCLLSRRFLEPGTGSQGRKQDA